MAEGEAGKDMGKERKGKERFGTGRAKRSD